MVFPVHIVAVAGIVGNNIGDVLLVKDRHKNEWTIPGGQVEEGENLIDAVVREVMEETGVNITVEKLVGIASNTGKYEGYNNVGTVPTKVMFDFVCKYVSGNLRESDETSEPVWVSKEQIPRYIQNESMRERINAYLCPDDTIQYLDYITKPEFFLNLKRDI